MRILQSWTTAALVVTGMLLSASPADASTGTYHVVLAPASAAGGASSSLSATISLDSGTRLGAVNLTAPPGFQLTSASLPSSSPGTASISGNVLELRHLGLTPHTSVTAGLTAVSACAPATYRWSAAATVEGNFTGSTLALRTTASNLSTTVASGCSLYWSTEPADAAIGQAITSAAFDPTGPPLQVEVLDGNGSLSTTSTAPITVLLSSNPGAGTLSGTTTVDAVGGVASFDDLSIDQPGTGYVLEADSPGIAGAHSSSFDETTSGTTCSPGQSCETGASTPTSSMDLSTTPAAPTTLSITVDPGTALQCAGYSAQDPNWYSFLSSSSASGKVVEYTVIPSHAGEVGFCLGAPYEFTTNTGAPAPPGTLPDGSSGFIGLLPRCTASSTGPCVDARTLTPDPNSPTGYDVTLKALFPAGLPGDPIGRV